MKKRILSILIAVLMVVSLMPATAFATGTTYAITNDAPESDKETNHGYIAIDKTSGAEGDTVTVTVNPADGYQLKSLTVVPAVLTFKAVYDTTGGANTLTFYYDAVDHSGEGKTVYEGSTGDYYLFDSTKSNYNLWGYNSNRTNIKSVIINESVKIMTVLHPRHICSTV